MGYKVSNFKNNSVRPLFRRRYFPPVKEVHESVEYFRRTGEIPVVKCKCRQPMVYKEGDSESGFHWRGNFCKRRKCDPIWY